MACNTRHHDADVQAVAKMFEKHLASGRFTTGDLFRDFCEVSYLAITQLTKRVPERAAYEGRYMAIMRRYLRADPMADPATRCKYGTSVVNDLFPKVFAELQLLAMRRMDAPADILGMVAGAMETLNDDLGQFFTPQPICELMARMTVDPAHLSHTIATKGHFSLQEPAIGGGAMVLALHGIVRKAGHDPSKVLFVHGIDISPQSFHMAALHFHVYGVAGVLHLGSALEGDIWKEARDTYHSVALVADHMPHREAFARPRVMRSTPRTRQKSVDA